MQRIIVIRATWDPEAEVWVAESTDVPGLVTEAPTLDDLQAKLPGIIQDLVEVDDGEGDLVEVAVEILASKSQRVQVRAPQAA
jgi:predicted RNase H-like HicB family nuclease